MKGKQDTAAMTPAEREALEVADLRAQIGPLFDIYMACIELIEEEGPAMVHSNLQDALCLTVVVRKKLGLAQPNEIKAFSALLAQRWLMFNRRSPSTPSLRSKRSWATTQPAWSVKTLWSRAPWSRCRGTSSRSS